MTINKKQFSILFVVCFLCNSITIIGQQTKIDSLKNIIDTVRNDSIIISTLNALSIEELNNENISGSLVYSNKALVLANKIDYKKGKAYALKNIGLAEYYLGNYGQVLENWTRSLETFELLQDLLGIANLSSNLGVIYYDQGGHTKALDYYLKSLGFAEKLNDPVRITTALVNIGAVYTEMQKYDLAVKYYQKIEKYLPTLNNRDINSTYLMGLGEVYGRQDSPKEAIRYYKEALKINKDSQGYAHNLTMIAREEYKLGNSEKAIEYLNLAYENSIQNKSSLDQVQTLLVLGNVYQKKEPLKALKLYKEGENIAIELDTKDELRDIYKGMSEVYSLIENYKNAYLYQDKYLNLKDQIFNIETSDKMRGLQFNFDLEKKQNEIGLLQKEAQILELNEKRQKIVKYISFVIAGLIFLLTLGLFKRYKYVQKTKKIIEEEKTRSDKLLLNILPEETALELKANGKVKAKKFESTTVLFTDFKGFTHYAENLSPEELVETIDFYFSKFDLIMEKYDLEKIKTVGDAYMCAGGLHANIEDHSHKMLLAALEIMEFVQNAFDNKTSDSTLFEVRIGVNSGPVVAGVVGTHKFAYDIWGDTVNVASRMESNAEAGKINISENTYQLVKDDFDCEYRGELSVKNRGMMKMYYVNGLKNEKVLSVLNDDKIEI